MDRSCPWKGPCQVLLHIAPGDPGYGSLFLGLHFYTWALVAFFALLARSGVVLMLDDRRRAPAEACKPDWLAKFPALAFLSILVVSLLSTTVECGFGPCPDNPTRYQWLPG